MGRNSASAQSRCAAPARLQAPAPFLQVRRVAGRPLPSGNREVKFPIRGWLFSFAQAPEVFSYRIRKASRHRIGAAAAHLIAFFVQLAAQLQFQPLKLRNYLTIDSRLKLSTVRVVQVLQRSHDVHHVCADVAVAIGSLAKLVEIAHGFTRGLFAVRGASRRLVAAFARGASRIALLAGLLARLLTRL